MKTTKTTRSASEDKLHRARWCKWWTSTRTMLRQYREGASQLLRDARQAWKHRSLSRTDRCRLLRRREAMAVRNALYDLARVVPILINPLPPPLGLAFIAVAYRYPRVMLSPQFHSAEQTEVFARLDAATQGAAATELTSSLNLDTIAKLLAGNADVHRVLESFENGGPLSLAALRRRDLLRLVKLAAPRAPSSCCPSFFLRRIVARAAADVQEDDTFLLADSVDLTDAELRDACVTRGLIGDDPPRHRLKLWLDHMANLRGAWRRDLPPAFLFIFAALLHHTPGATPTTAPQCDVV